MDFNQCNWQWIGDAMKLFHAHFGQAIYLPKTVFDLFLLARRCTRLAESCSHQQHPWSSMRLECSLSRTRKHLAVNLDAPPKFHPSALAVRAKIEPTLGCQLMNSQHIGQFQALLGQIKGPIFLIFKLNMFLFNRQKLKANKVGT